MSDQGTHESFRQRDEVKGSSNRSFGIVFTVVFSIIGLFPLIGGTGPRLWALAIALLFLVAAFAFPKALAPLNRLWMRFGLLLHRIINPLIMALLFFVVVTPIALIMRILGKRPLLLKADPNASTYWIPREPPGPAPETMKQQF
jgi:large-conductance mechanosensitive channel